MKLWVEAAQSEPKWELIFANYRSAVDFPAAAYWQQLAEFYPDAKVVHTMRDPDDWFESTQATIFSKESPAARAKLSGERSLPLDYFESFTKSFAAHMHDRAFMTDYFRRQTESVKAVIPRERLLVYAVDEGWAPLCGFLNAPIPTTPFPVFNTRADFIARVMKPTAA